MCNNNSDDFKEDSWYRIVYICCCEKNLRKTLFALRRKHRKRDGIRYKFLTIKDLKKLYPHKVVDIVYDIDKYKEDDKKDRKYQCKTNWLDWLIKKVDMIWICDSNDYSDEIKIAKKYNIPIERR